ncbi:MAG: hypothetical protein ACW99U_18950 [Candidatus Thorarchaeota archaeon]
MQETNDVPGERVRWFDNPAYGYTRRTDSIIILLVIVVFSLPLVLRITIEGFVFTVIIVALFAFGVRGAGLHRTPFKIGLSSKGLFIIRGIRKKTSFIAWSSIECIRVTRVFPSFAEPSQQVALIFEVSREKRSAWNPILGISVVKALADKITEMANVPVKRGRLGSS